MKRNHLFKFELRKILHGPSTYIGLTIAVLFIALNLLLTWLIAFELIGADDFSLLVESLNGYNPNFGTTIPSSTFWTILLIFLATYLNKDYTDKTIKNIYGRGVSREEYLFVRLFYAFVLSTIFFALCLFTEYIVSSWPYHAWKIADIPLTFKVIGLEYLSTLTFACFAVLVCTIAKKVGSAISLCILGPSIISLVFSIIDASIYSSSKSDDPFQITDYYFYTQSSEMINYLIDSEGFADFAIENICINAGWIAAFVLLSWLISRNDKI